MPRHDTFDLIGKQLERNTPEGWKERGTITTLLPDGCVVVEIKIGRTVVVDPEKDNEWRLVD